MRVLQFPIMWLPLYAEMKPQVAGSDQCYINNFAPAKTVADDHVFLGGSNRIIKMSIPAFVPWLKIAVLFNAVR